MPNTSTKKQKAKHDQHILGSTIGEMDGMMDSILQNIGKLLANTDEKPEEGVNVIL